MVLAYSFCNVSVMPVRSEPSHKAEQVNQLLFGERAEVLEVNDKDWARIRGEWDDYEGWCKISQLTFITFKEYRKSVRNLCTKHTNRLIFDDSEMILPLGSELLGLKHSKILLANKDGKFKGKKINFKKAELDCDSLKDWALQYMHAPYQWGGRSILGIDCSGLSQMAYKMCGKRIPRDASQQAMEGDDVDFLQNSRCGDLAFFDNAEGNIIHVGIILDNQTIIHAADSIGRVVIDRIDQGGIISIQLKKRTHNLRMVKRYM